MTRRSLIKDLILGKSVDRCGLWIGKPEKRTIDIYCSVSELHNLEEIEQFLGDDVRWITPQYVPSTYKHPEGKKMRPWKEINPYGLAGGPLSEAITTAEINAYDWPQTKYLDFSESIAILKNTGDYYRLSGFWSPFYHDLTYLLGTENLFIKMYTHPEVVHCILDKVCDFYYSANELFYRQAGDLVDGFFFGNDFGSQNDLLFSPELFNEFFLPWIKKFSEQAHRYGYQSVLHSCGSIHRIINQLADAGVDCIHPIQAQAAGMDAVTLSRDFKGKITFMGGIDSQILLTNGTPEEILHEVDRVKQLLGPNIIIGPSHEVLLPDVPFENVIAMAKGALIK